MSYSALQAEFGHIHYRGDPGCYRMVDAVIVSFFDTFYLWSPKWVKAPRLPSDSGDGQVLHGYHTAVDLTLFGGTRKNDENYVRERSITGRWTKELASEQYKESYNTRSA